MMSPSPTRSRALQSLIPDERPVLASEVFDRHPACRNRDSRMSPRDSGGVQKDLDVRVTADHVRPFVERDAAVHPFQPEGDVAATASRTGQSLRWRPCHETRSQTGGRSE